MYAHYPYYVLELVEEANMLEIAEGIQAHTLIRLN